MRFHRRRSCNMRALRPQQLFGLYGEERDDQALQRPAKTKSLPVYRARNRSPRIIFCLSVKIQVHSGCNCLNQDYQD